MEERNRSRRALSIPLVRLGAILPLGLLLAGSSAQAQQTSAWAWWYFRGVEDTTLVEGEERRESAGPTEAEVTNPQSEGSASATVTSSWGLGGVNAQSIAFTEVNVLEASGQAAWEDTITIYGSLGIGTMPIEIWVSGTLAASGDGGAQVICELMKDGETVGEELWVDVSAAGGSVSQNLSEVCGGILEFEYGEPFVLSSYLTAYSWVPPSATIYEAYSGNAAANFGYTARLAVFDLPQGAWAETASGTVYPVPEPNAVQLCVSVFAALAVLVVRRGHRAT